MKDPTGAVDLETTLSAIAKVRDYAMGRGLMPSRESVMEMVAEYDRIAGKLADMTQGRTTLVMSGADRARAAIDLDDESLAKFARWALVKTQEIYDDAARDKGVEPSAITTMHGVISLAMLAFSTSASQARFSVEGVTYADRAMGDWEVIVRRTGNVG